MRKGVENASFLISVSGSKWMVSKFGSDEEEARAKNSLVIPHRITPRL